MNVDSVDVFAWIESEQRMWCDGVVVVVGDVNNK